MNHYIKARTNGIICQGSHNQLKILEEMFPLYSIDQNNISQTLDKYFDQSDPQHFRFLQQACFKFPIAGVSKVYEDFRKNKCSFVAEPNISNYFNNKSFISLKVLENWLDGQGQYPSVENADVLKQQIAQALLRISQQFGYIPNLERFLLYYPNYLLKVQKFKNRFFQQIVQQTSQVTYLSPKNCCFAGLIAAIYVGCPYMITRMANMFLVRGGSPSWITDKKYPQQFNQLFGLFRKIAVAPFSLNQDDLNFSSAAWGKQVYFDLITAGIFVMSMSTLCLAMGLNCDEPCKYIPLSVILDIKNTYDSEKCLNKSSRIQILQQIKQIISQQKILKKEEVQEIQAKQVQPYMKQIGSKLSAYSLYNKFNQVFQFFGMPKHSPINIKYKDNSFFHRNRDVIQKGLEEQRKSDSIQDTKFQCFKSYCIQGSKMALRIFGKTEQNVRIFRKLVQILTYNLCGYHNQQFDYKNNIKLNADLSMPLKFYIRLLSISPLYINKQVLQQINHDKQGKWEQCFDLGHLAITVAENKAKLLMSSIQFQLFK